MVNQRQPLKVQADKKNLRKVESTPVELAEELTGLERLPGGPMLAFGGGSAEDQAARLGDMRLQGAQRRALARQIGRAQGNLHLQRVVHKLREDEEEPIPSRSSSLLGEAAGAPQAVPGQGRDEQEAYPVVTNPYTFVQRGLFGLIGGSSGALMDPDPVTRGGLGGIPIPMPNVGRGVGGLGGMLGGLGGGGLGGLGGILSGIGGGGGMGGSGGMLGGTPGPAQGGLGLSGMMAMALQQQMQKQQQVFQMMSNMMKMQHQAAMAVIRNIR